MMQSHYSNPMPNAVVMRGIARSIRDVGIDKGGNAVQRSVDAVAHEGGGDLRFHILFFAAYPLFLSVEIFNACVKATTAGHDAPLRNKGSMFATAKNNASIAISYAFMARSTLQIFARNACRD